MEMNVKNVMMASAVLVLAGAAWGQVEPSAGMLRWPDISKDRICFVYANDIWVASKAGGVALPLASPAGQESFPRFSPDGKMIAFVGNYEGGRDIYTLAVSGGVPTRVTYHPAAETLADWTPEGKLLYITNGFSGLARQTQMWRVDAAGGLPEKMPVPYAGFGSLSSDGKRLAYTLHSTDTRTWKRYRGGMATDVWVVNLETHASKRLTDWEGTDTLPMWIPGVPGTPGDDRFVYYLSDKGAEHRLNIWRCAADGLGTNEQVTKFTEDDVRWPSIGPGDDGKGEIVFQLGSELRVLDLGSGRDRVVKVTIPGARPTIKARTVDAGKNVASGGISPGGKRVVLEARGDVWTVPAKEGVSRNLTRTDGVYERSPAYSPDGKWIAYFSDVSGEYELYVRTSDAKPPLPEKKKDPAAKDAKEGKEEEKKAEEKKDESAPPVPSEALAHEARKLTSFGPGFRTGLAWSPDSKWIAVTDNTGKLMLVAAEEGKKEIKDVDQDPWGNGPSVAFSHDSGWLAYTKGDEGNSQSCVWLYEMASGTKTQVTSGMFSTYSPVFDHKGEYLYAVSSRAIERPVYSDVDNSFAYADTMVVLAFPLRGDVKSPLAPKTDEESFKTEKAKEEKKDTPDAKKGEEKKEEPKDDAKKDEPKKDDPKKDEKKPPLKIELAGIEARAIMMPIKAGLMDNLAVSDSGKLVYVRRDKVRDDGDPSGGGVKVFDPAADEKKEEAVTDGGSFDITPDGKKLLVFRGGADMVICDPAAGAKVQKVPTGGLMVTVQPREEWKQILADTWRLERDYFYEPTLHGVDWKKIGEHYKRMVEDAVTREDVAWIQAEMISELNIGHAYVTNPGEIEGQPQVSVGMLGCDFERGENGVYKISRIITGAAWDADARGPLSQPGVEVKEGDYLLAVNGVPVDTARDPWASLQGLAGKTVTITVNARPVIDASARDCVVKPIAAETGLRYRAYIESKRKYVEERTQGQVGYIYVPNTGVDGQNDLFRQFYGQRDMAALIIDERWNGGGQIPSRFIELLNRPVSNYWARRNGKDWTWPPDSHQGPKCMLANGLAGSGGDMFPWLFKYNKIGPVIGTRTWGGLVGISGNPGLIDGGAITVPTFGFYKKDGTWGVEGHGTDPDIEVIDDPALMWNGGDPQLNRAIEEMLKAVKEHGYAAPKRPASPNRSGMGVEPRDR